MSKTLDIILYSPEVDERPIFIVGNFNNWTPQLVDYQLHSIGRDRYKIHFSDISSLPEELEFKFTKGDWSEVEIDRFGSRTSNRKLNKNVTISEQFVVRWRENWLPYEEEHLPRIKLVDNDFFIPQMNKHRKVWALLPHDYETSTKNYPVLYLHDAQNLFNESAPYGNWGIDKKLAVLSDYGWGDIIIIAIEHGNKDRLIEYSVNNPFYGIGEGKKYLRFVSDTLKPYIDKKYRTKPQREYTGMGGSSLGGLISLYGGMLYPEVYSKLMIFSPSLWLVPEMKFTLMPFANPFDTRIYLYGGAKESETMVPHIMEFKESIDKLEDSSAKIDFRLSINPNGQHNEQYWSIEFPKAVEWLFFDKGTIDTAFHQKDYLNLRKPK